VPPAGTTEEVKAGVALLESVIPLTGAAKAVPPGGTTEEMKTGAALLVSVTPLPSEV